MLEGRCKRRGPHPPRVLPSGTCKHPNLGARVCRAPAAPPRESQHQALTRRAGSAALSAPRPPARRRRARWLGARRPPGTRSAASPAWPSWAPSDTAAAAAAATRAAAESCAGRAVGERAGLPAPPRAALPASRAPGSLGEQRKKDRGGGGGEAGRRREGALGRRQAREEGARRASCRGGCPAPPRRPRGVRRPRREGGRHPAGGDSQTPVSLAAAARAWPGPAHCGRWVLYNSAVRRHPCDSGVAPGGPQALETGAKWGWGLGIETEGPGAPHLARGCSDRSVVQGG